MLAWRDPHSQLDVRTRLGTLADGRLLSCIVGDAAIVLLESIPNSSSRLGEGLQTLASQNPDFRGDDRTRRQRTYFRSAM